MELREPPRPPAPRASPAATWLLALGLVLLLAIAARLWLPAPAAPAARHDDAARRVAAKLQAAGLADEAAAAWGRYLERVELPASERAAIAYAIGESYREAGRPERALRWYYEAESLGAGELPELGGRIVATLERLGRHHAAEAALASSVRLEPAEAAGEDPVVARIGERAIPRSTVERALDDLPPELAAQFTGSDGRRAFLRRWVAEELLWRKATKLGYDDDPEVRRAQETLLRQLSVAKFVEREVVPTVQVDEADLRNYFEAHRDRYRPASEGAPEPDFEALRPRLERDYRLEKLQAAYRDLVDSELAAAGVELYEERMAGGG